MSKRTERLLNSIDKVVPPPAPVRNALTRAAALKLTKTDPMSRAAHVESEAVAHKFPDEPHLREQAAREHESAALAHDVAADRHADDLGSPVGEAYHRSRAAYHRATAAHLRSGTFRTSHGVFHVPGGGLGGRDLMGRPAWLEPGEDPGSHDVVQRQRATASADERAYHGVQHLLPGFTPEGIEDADWGEPKPPGAHEPSVFGMVDRSHAATRKTLKEAGYRETYRGDYDVGHSHPETGHEVITEGDFADRGRTVVTYSPRYDPAHYS